MKKGRGKRDQTLPVNMRDIGQAWVGNRKPLTYTLLYPAGQNTVYGKKGLKRVHCLEKFTIPDKKVLVVEIFEKNGGRVMTFKMKNRNIVRAATINFSKGRYVLNNTRY